nr:TMV resistance protein N-like [Ipomoea trifida]
MSSSWEDVGVAVASMVLATFSMFDKPENVFLITFTGAPCFPISAIASPNSPTVEANFCRIPATLSTLDDGIFNAATGEASDDPKRYSRLWLPQDISQLLIGSEGTVNIQGIAFNLPVATDVKVSSEAFTHMAKLRLVKFHNVNASQAPNFLPGELRWLDWHGYPSKSPMACLLEVHAEATGIREVPSSIECLTNLRLIDVSNCKHLASLPSSICRLKGVKAVILSGCSKFEKLPDELGEMECLEELYCDKTAIQELPSSISLLKKLKILSFSGCKPLASPIQKSSSFFQYKRLLTAGGFEAIKASPFPSLSGLSSLEMLDLSDCSMLDGGIILDDLRELHCLKVLNLRNNKFGCIPAESIAGLTRLEELHLVGCERLQSLPELPSSIKEVYADECPSLEGRSIDSLTKYPNLRCVSFTKCAQLLEDPCYSHIVDAIWQHLLKGLSNHPNRSISVCFPGMVFPEWFTYKNWGNSLSVSLPQNWYNNKFMGFAFCVVSNLITIPTSMVSYIITIINYGLVVEIIPTTRDGPQSPIITMLGYNGVKQNMKSEFTCLSYMSFDDCNEWCQIEVSGYSGSAYTGIGMRLVYEDDVKTSDELLMIQNNIVSTNGVRRLVKMTGEWRETKVAKTSTGAMLKSNAKPVSESDQQMLSFSSFWKGDDSLAAWLSASKLELMFKLEQFVATGSFASRRCSASSSSPSGSVQEGSVARLLKKSGKDSVKSYLLWEVEKLYLRTAGVAALSPVAAAHCLTPSRFVESPVSAHRPHGPHPSRSLGSSLLQSSNSKVELEFHSSKTGMNSSSF